MVERRSSISSSEDDAGADVVVDGSELGGDGDEVLVVLASDSVDVVVDAEVVLVVEAWVVVVPTVLVVVSTATGSGSRSESPNTAAMATSPVRTARARNHHRV